MKALGEVGERGRLLMLLYGELIGLVSIWRREEAAGKEALLWMAHLQYCLQLSSESAAFDTLR